LNTALDLSQKDVDTNVVDPLVILESNLLMRKAFEGIHHQMEVLTLDLNMPGKDSTGDAAVSSGQ
jgi:hypothetical protein